MRVCAISLLFSIRRTGDYTIGLVAPVTGPCNSQEPKWLKAPVYTTHGKVRMNFCYGLLFDLWFLHGYSNEHINEYIARENEPNSTSALASQPTAGHSLNLFITVIFMTWAKAFLFGRPQKVAAEFGSHCLTPNCRFCSDLLQLVM